MFIGPFDTNFLFCCAKFHYCAWFYLDKSVRSVVFERSDNVRLLLCVGLPIACRKSVCVGSSFDTSFAGVGAVRYRFNVNTIS